MEFLKGWSGVIYLVAILGAGMIIERVIPWRRVAIDGKRWLRNASMTFYSVIILSFFPVLAAYAIALAAQAQNFGLLNWLAAPLWAAIAVTVIAADLISYTVHRSLHKWYFLWRLHRTHHADEHVDVSTSLRFHPFEAFFRATVSAPLAFLIGYSPEGVLAHFAVQAAINTLTHMNIGLPISIDRVVSRVFITPHVHHLHHSSKPDHLDRNFGTIFSFWDQLFGTFCPPENIAVDEPFGIDGPEAIKIDSFANLVLDPFRTPAGGAIPKAAAQTAGRLGASPDVHD